MGRVTATTRTSARDVCLHQLVAEQAERTPGAVALIDGDRRLDYGALLARVRSLASALRRRGVRPETVVGIGGLPALDSLVAALGVLAAGGAFMPLDADQPADRIGGMLADAG